MRMAVGIDIGGTNTRVALIDENLKIIKRIQFPTNIENPYDTLKKITFEIKNFDFDICGIGLSCPGPLDLINGVVLDTPNLKGNWHNLSICKELKKLCGYSVFLENDANLATLAEAVIGKGKNYNFVQFLTISTGIGSGFSINRRIYTGSHGFANEVANSCMWKDGPSHGSIYKGGIEAISSGTAIVERAHKAGLSVSHAGEVNDLAMLGNRKAMIIMEEAKEYLSNFCATLIAVLDPEIIILAGSVALKIDGFVESIAERVKTKVYDNVKPYVNIVASDLNEDSGLLGAAYLVFQNILS